MAAFSGLSVSISSDCSMLPSDGWFSFAWSESPSDDGIWLLEFLFPWTTLRFEDFEAQNKSAPVQSAISMKIFKGKCCLKLLSSLLLSLSWSLSDLLDESELWTLLDFLMNQTFHWMANQIWFSSANQRAWNPNPRNWLKNFHRKNRTHLY